jgi:hypothetical protein
MSLILNLPSDLENALTAEADRLHVPLHDYAVRLLAVNGPLSPKPLTGKEVIAYWEEQGLIGTRPDIADAAEHARALRNQAEKRARS